MLRSLLIISNNSHVLQFEPLLSNYNIKLIHRVFSTVDDCGGDNKEGSSNNEKCEDIQIPEPPTSCCMSGCDNCVWIEYAEELSKLFKDEGERSRKIIMEKVTDENMKAFLNMELSFLQRLNEKDKNGDNIK